MDICEIISEYKRLKLKLTENVGCEESTIGVGWNDSIIENINDLLEYIPEDITKRIRLNHI